MTSYIYNMVDTWASGGGPYTSIKMNATDNDSGSASLLMDLQVGGASKFKVAKSGDVTLGSSSILMDAVGGSITAGGTYSSNAAIGFRFLADLFLRRRGAANLALGAADAAAPVAQTLSVQSVVAGTTNTAGTNLTITGSQGTGTGAGGSIIFQVAPAGGSGTAQNALATALTINPAGTVSIGGMTIDSGNGAVTFLQTFGITMQTANAFMIRHGNGDGLDVRPVSSGSPNIQLKNASNAIQAGLWGEATNTLALRNGTAAQTFRVYNTYDGTNNEWGALDWVLNATSLSVGTFKSGSGSSRALQFVVGGTNIATFAASGHMLWNTDNNYDIGASGATRPRNVYVGSNVIAGGYLAAGVGSSVFFGGNARSRASSSADGDVMISNASATDFAKLQFGGTTSSFPALKRSSTTLQARLADDSAFAPVQGKLTTDTAYTAGAIVATGYLTLYDSTGTAYRVPCVV